jgi:hypothetical protein
MITKQYKLINNIGGWVIFVVALITYWLTLEPTASYWDCGEFIIQADKLEIGHPPGNPIFMLTARFFANFASSPQTVALMVNAMSGLLSALTILLLFWTITHLVRRLTVKDTHEGELSLTRYLVIMGSGVVGALAYAWSDTFWFSAVEGEVYAFSSFCTALVFWLILKWENRADDPASDRYLILIAYIIGVSVAVHLLNLLCIPAIALVFAYRKFKNMNVKKSLAVLGVSFAVIVFVLYGMVPGVMKVAQVFELMFVNGFGMPFNSGALAYLVLTVLVFGWCLYTLQRQKSANGIRLSFLVAVAFSGVLCFTSSAWVWLVLLLALAAVLFVLWKDKLPVRILSVVMWSIAVIFVGYSSYALILIRSTADTPMNQNSPDNVFDLASYLNREQYGDNPLFYGETYNSDVQRIFGGYEEYNMGNYDGVDYTLYYPQYSANIEYGKSEYGKGVKGADSPTGDGLNVDEINTNKANALKGGDYYVKKGHKYEPKMNPELNMFFPRIYSGRLASHRKGYEHWVPSLKDSSIIIDNLYDIYAIDATTGDEVQELDLNKDYDLTGPGTLSFPAKRVFRPTYKQNLEYFFNYQLGHMYFRYFLWNFAGRQNDRNNQWGEMDEGNWISGIPFIDSARLGDQSYLPDDLGKNNAGHNVFYMLPLLLGILGLLWQAFSGDRGIEQFWVVFFLFFMTGIAIVLYLNQPPNQPRERDYAFAGSFYAYAIWIGMGVAALWRMMLWAIERRKAKAAQKNAATAEARPVAASEEETNGRIPLICAGISLLLGIIVPLQMVSQTWDDHDRSGRYAARDYAVDYLESTEPNAIIFCNGDNDTFPLWYAQEVEGVRPDVRIMNLSYLASDWYVNQFRMPAYEAAAVPMTVKPEQCAYEAMQAVTFSDSSEPMSLIDALRAVYAGSKDTSGRPMLPTTKVYVPIDKELMVKKGYAADTAQVADKIWIDLTVPDENGYPTKNYLNFSELLMLDIIATNAENGWERPIYWASTVGTEYYMGLDNYMATVGMDLQLVPYVLPEAYTPRSERSYNVIMNKYRWGGADVKEGQHIPYFDQTASNMLYGSRNSIVSTAQQLLTEGNELEGAAATEKYKKALTLTHLLEEKQPAIVRPYSVQIAPALAELYCELGDKLNDRAAKKRGLQLFESLLARYAQYVVYEDYLCSMFGSVQLSYTTNYIPYYYYSFVENYKKYGGDFDAFVKRTPIMVKVNMENAKSKWDLINGNAQYGAESGSLAEAQGLVDMVVEMASLSPEEYSKKDVTSRYVDSVFYELIESSQDYGYTKEQIMSLKNIDKVDMSRQKRLYDEYVAKHPDLQR